MIRAIPTGPNNAILFSSKLTSPMLLLVLSTSTSGLDCFDFELPIFYLQQISLAIKEHEITDTILVDQLVLV